MGLLLALAKSLFMVISVTLTAKVLSPTLEVMRPSMAPCSASNSCSLCRRPWWSLLQASTDTTDSRARTTTGPSTKRANVSTRYRTGSPSGAVGKCKKEICIVWNWGKTFIVRKRATGQSNFLVDIKHLMVAETSDIPWWYCCCTCPGSSIE